MVEAAGAIDFFEGIILHCRKGSGLGVVGGGIVGIQCKNLQYITVSTTELAKA